MAQDSLPIPFRTPKCLGTAMNSFNGPDYGKEYLTFTARDRVLLLPTPVGSDPQGWTYGCVCSEPGWFPGAYWSPEDVVEVEEAPHQGQLSEVEEAPHQGSVIKAAQREALFAFCQRFGLSNKSARKVATKLSNRSSFEDDLSWLALSLEGHRNPAAALGEKLKLLEPTSSGPAYDGHQLLVPTSSGPAYDRDLLLRVSGFVKDKHPGCIDYTVMYRQPKAAQQKAGHKSPKFQKKGDDHELAAAKEALGLSNMINHFRPQQLVSLLEGAGGSVKLKALSLAAQVLALSKTSSRDALQEEILEMLLSRPDLFSVSAGGGQSNPIICLVQGGKAQASNEALEQVDKSAGSS